MLSVTNEATLAEATVLGNRDTDISAGVINWKSHKEFYEVHKALQRRCRHVVCHFTYQKGKKIYIVLAEKLGVKGGKNVTCKMCQHLLLWTKGYQCNGTSAGIPFAAFYCICIHTETYQKFFAWNWWLSMHAIMVCCPSIVLPYTWIRNENKQNKTPTTIKRS